MFFQLAQSSGGIGRTANELSKAASEKGLNPIFIVLGIVVVIAIAVLLFKLKRE